MISCRLLFDRICICVVIVIIIVKAKVIEHH